MQIKNLTLLDEGSWALMIEETNVRALEKYRGSMADLDIDYYLSVATNRYYKGYFEAAELARIRANIVKFLTNDQKYESCVERINEILSDLQNSGERFEQLDLAGKFHLYCELLREYIAYYNSVITDSFYLDVFDILDAEFEPEMRFASKAIKDALFATNNNELQTHVQTIDMLAIARRHLDGQDVHEDVEDFIEKYRATTISSGSPDGMTAKEVRHHLAQQTPETVQSEQAFLDNLYFRYSNSGVWSARTASAVGLSARTRLIIRRTAALSYLKIKMREQFQEFKVTSRRIFLNALVKEIGKGEFDYMRIDEIAEYIATGSRVPTDVVSQRQALTVFELTDKGISLSNTVPDYANTAQEEREARSGMSGDVLIGSGLKRYRVRKVEQHEEGLSSFDQFIQSVDDKEDVAVITNVLRPHLVPKLRQFGALITQYGGYTSHASVLCRELRVNSIISVDGLLDALQTGDFIEVDFDRGTIARIDDGGLAQSSAVDDLIDLATDAVYSSEHVGAKAANLIKINKTAKIVGGFVITSHALTKIDEASIQREILDGVNALNCDQVVIRSSHESEDGSAGSYAGLFESFVNVDANDPGKLIELVRSVYGSKDAESVGEYGAAKGDMSVIIQEMIAADVSGVVMSSNPFDGYDYLLVEYVAGDLSYLMQGDVTPLSAYIRKADVLEGREDYRSYPAVLTDRLGQLFGSLAKTAIDLERQFLHRVQIEWGIRGDDIYIFQVRPY